MKKKIFLLSLFTIIAACLISTVAVGNSGNVLRFGTSADYLPFVYYDEKGELTGIDIELVQEIGRRMGVSVEVADIAFDGLIDALNVGQVDLIGGAFSITPLREQSLDFSEVYFSGKAELIALNGHAAATELNESSMQGMKIGVCRGTSFDQWTKTNLVGRGMISASDVYEFTDQDQMMRALDERVIDAAMLDQDVYNEEYKPRGQYEIFYAGITEEEYAFGAMKGSALLPTINQHLVEMLHDGTAQKIANSFFSQDYSQNSIAPTITRPPQPIPSIDRPTNVPQPIAPVPVAQACVNAMQFVADITIPDGSSVGAGQVFTKVWQVYNNGTCTWGNGYSFNYVSGTNLGISSVPINATVQPGQSFNLTVQMRAPNAAGNFQTNWQMRSPQGAFFGQTLYARINSIYQNAQPGQPQQPQANVPHINVFQPDYAVGAPASCPVVTWNVNDCTGVKFYINDRYVDWSSNANDSKRICNWNNAPNGTVFSYKLQAMNGSAVSWSQFNYTIQCGRAIPVVSQPTPVPVIPVISQPTPVPVIPVISQPTPVPVIPVIRQPTPVPVVQGSGPVGVPVIGQGAGPVGVPVIGQ